MLHEACHGGFSPMPPQNIHLRLVQPDVSALCNSLLKTVFTVKTSLSMVAGLARKASADAPDSIFPSQGDRAASNQKRGISACSHLSCSGMTPRPEQTQALAWVFPFQALARNPTTCTSPRLRTHSQARMGRR